MYKKTVLLCTLLSLAACSSSSDTHKAQQKQEVIKVQAAEPQQTRTEPTVTKDSDLICRTERPLGTRFGKKVCRTKAQIAEERKQAKDLLPRHRECTGPREVCI